MYYMIGFRRFGKAFVALLSVFLVTVVSTQVGAETIETVNGEAIDSAVLDFYLLSRTQRPVEQVTVIINEPVLFNKPFTITSIFQNIR